MAHQRILENQIAQSASSSQTKAFGKLPSQPEAPDKAQINAIHLRSGREVEIPQPKSPKKKEVQEDENPTSKEAADNDPPIQKPLGKNVAQPKVNLSTLPFPQRFLRNKLDAQFGRFLTHMKDISISLPFLDVIRDMPSWGKFLKDIIAQKGKFDDPSMVALVHEAPSFLASMPKKM